MSLVPYKKKNWTKSLGRFTSGTPVDPFLRSARAYAKRVYRDQVDRQSRLGPRVIGSRPQRPIGSKPSGTKTPPSGAMAENTPSTRGASSKKLKTVKSMHFKNKEVHVSSKFKKMVLQVAQKDKISGIYETLNYGYLAATAGNFQSIGHTEVGFATYSKWAFTPEFFLDALSVLFNGKTPTSNLKAQTTAGTLGLQAGTNALNIKFNVRSSHEYYFLKNNTNRTATISIYLCEPKFNSTLLIANNSIVTGASVNVTNSLQDPELTWTQACIDTIQNATSIALGGVYQTPQTLLTKPTQFSEWKKSFTHELTEIVLEPGQTYKYSMKGPEDLLIDFNKMYKNGVLYTLPKYCRYPMFVTRYDLIGTTTVNALRAAGGVNSASGNGILYERRMSCCVNISEQVGFTYPAAFVAGALQNLNLRRPATFRTTWQVAQTGVETKVDEEAPATPYDPN